MVNRAILGKSKNKNLELEMNVISDPLQIYKASKPLFSLVRELQLCI